MSASALLAYISAAIVIQVGVAVAVAFWRRGREATSPAVSPSPPSHGDHAIPSVWQGWREFRVVRREYEDRAQTLCSFYLEPVDGVPLVPFVPGQYLTFAVPITADQTLTRCYSLSDGPNSKAYRISVKRALAPSGRPELPRGKCSNKLFESLQLGDVIQAKAPAGRFVVDLEPNLSIVLVAGGCGITPLLSMLRGGLAADSNQVVHLYYGIRHGAEHAFRSELEELARLHPNFHLNVVYSQPATDDVSGKDYQHTGYIDINLLRRTLPAGRFRFYVCGPPAMMANLLPALGQWGVLANDIHHEAFGPISAWLAPPATREQNALVPAASLFQIRFRKTGRTLTWDGTDTNLLDFAERHDVPVDSGCRSGSCGMCEVKVMSGTVRYTQQPDHEVTVGHCLLCVGLPDGPLELDA